MKKVKLLAPWAGPLFNHSAGKVVNVTESQFEQLVASGSAREHTEAPQNMAEMPAFLFEKFLAWLKARGETGVLGGLFSGADNTEPAWSDTLPTAMHATEIIPAH